MLSEIKISSIAKYYKADEDFLIIELFKDAEITLEKVKQTSYETHTFMKLPRYNVLLDTSNHNTWHIPTEVLKYLANNEYSLKQIGFAIVANSIPMRIIAKFFISYYKPVIPTKLFASRERAEKWLYSLTN